MRRTIGIIIQKPEKTSRSLEKYLVALGDYLPEGSSAFIGQKPSAIGNGIIELLLPFNHYP